MLGADIKGEAVLQVLSQANERAIKHEGQLPPDNRKYWLDVIDLLANDKTPKTYMAVFAVM